MRPRLRDVVATVLVLAIVVPYVGFLVNGEMPLVQDVRGMSAIGLLLGATAFLVLKTADEDGDLAGRIETGLALVALGLGLVTLALAETAAAEILLAIFMGSILVVWALEMADHAGITPWHDASRVTGT